MATAMLLSVDELRERLGFGERPDIDTALENALKQTTISLEARLRTKFDRVDATDTFFVKWSLDHAGTFQDRDAERRLEQSSQVSQTPLKLSRGLVDSITSAYASSTVNGLSAASSRTDLTTVLDGSSALLLREEEGELRIVDFGMTNLYVQVVYKAGLLTDDGCPARFESVPDWLVELAVIEASLLLNSNPNVRRESLPEDELKSLKELRGNIVLDHARYFPGAWKTKDSNTVASIT